MLTLLKEKKKKISVTGLGYVGLPLALELARKYAVIGFDINEERIQMIKKHQDPSNELEKTQFEGTDIIYTADSKDLIKAHFHIIGVPTDINEDKTPDLNPLIQASRSIGSILKKGDVVVYESTVFPGCTEDICVPILEESSGLKLGEGFKIGYSPERIVPGNKNKPLTQILKIVSGSDLEVTDLIEQVYGSIIIAGIHRAPSIKTAEAAKIIENTQRDLNISLMNELAIIFDKMNIDIHDVIEAAGTKWNFHKYYPGLVGGHCIGVDPYYLIYKSKLLGIEPEVIAAGRKINDGIPRFIASKLTKRLLEIKKSPLESRILIMGVTFKENVSDIRNSKVFDLVSELKAYSLQLDIVDPYANFKEVKKYYGVSLNEKPSGKYDAAIVCVSHDSYKQLKSEDFDQLLTKTDGIIFDIKGMYSQQELKNFFYWKL